jgi:hypothetical protein
MSQASNHYTANKLATLFYQSPIQSAEARILRTNNTFTSIKTTNDSMHVHIVFFKFINFKGDLLFHNYYNCRIKVY